jgi:hypothetical protein
MESKMDKITKLHDDLTSSINVHAQENGDGSMRVRMSIGPTILSEITYTHEHWRRLLDARGVL